ncbi:MAG: DUF4330 domain-containing protein [Defluviitaleaceae bacterium]|nr:DUF4330 domain-containing protein [Defluviitaleaceae bacterium]
MIDRNGRLFGKLSVLDVAVVLLFAAMVAGFVIRGGTTTAGQVMAANQQFEVVLSVERVRIYSVNAVNIGDMFFEQHAALLGQVIDYWYEPADDIVRTDGGDLVVMQSEYRYNLFVRLRAQGFINEQSGFYIGGNNHVVPGQLIRVQSNNIFAHMTIHEVSAR